MQAWHESEEYWESVAPLMFGAHVWDAAPTEVDGIVARLDLAPGSSVLDMACGPGRHAIELARRGHVVSAVDRTRSLLEDGRRRALEGDVQGVTFLDGDMRYFRRDDAFDAAIMVFGSFGYFERESDDADVVRQLTSSIKPGGALLLDLMGKELIARNFRPEVVRDMGDGLTLRIERTVQPGWGRVGVRWTLERAGQVKQLESYMRPYSATEICLLLERHGLEDVEIFGDFDGSPYDIDARRLVAVARRPSF